MASEKNLNLKKETVQTIVDKIKGSETVVLFAYQGLKVADISDLRKKLRDDQAEVRVYKNTLVKRAFDELNLNLDEYLEGPNAILFSTKLLEAIKVLSTFAKEHEDLKIRAGVIKGDIVNVDTIKEYANIPSMEGLLTMLAGGMIEHVKNLSVSLKLYAENLNDGKPIDSPTNEASAKEEVPAETAEAKEETLENNDSPAETANESEETVQDEVANETPLEEAVNEETTEEVPSEETKEEN